MKVVVMAFECEDEQQAHAIANLGRNLANAANIDDNAFVFAVVDDNEGEAGVLFVGVDSIDHPLEEPRIQWHNDPEEIADIARVFRFEVARYKSNLETDTTYLGEIAQFIDPQ